MRVEEGGEGDDSEYVSRHCGRLLFGQDFANGQYALMMLNRHLRALCVLSASDVDGIRLNAGVERRCRIGCSIGFVRHATFPESSQWARSEHQRTK